jgi:hypothetical protein
MTSRSPIQRLIDASSTMCCTICAQPMGTCQCWEDCSCGNSTLRGTSCTNPLTTDCSTKLKYGTPAQQAAWFDRLGTQAANEVVWYIDQMYPKMWENVSRSGARTSVRNVMRRAVAKAIRLDRNAQETEEEAGP